MDAGKVVSPASVLTICTFGCPQQIGLRTMTDRIATAKFPWQRAKTYLTAESPCKSQDRVVYVYYMGHPMSPQSKTTQTERIPVQTSSPIPDNTSSTQCRGRIARLPRKICEHLNTSHNDGEEAEKAEKTPTLHSNQSRLVKASQGSRKNPPPAPNPPNTLSYNTLGLGRPVKRRLYPNPEIRRRFHHQTCKGFQPVCFSCQ